MIRTSPPVKSPNCIITLESLNRLFEQNNNPATYSYQGRCDSCGSPVKLRIKKTSGGYGLLGGILYEPYPENYFVLCVECLEENKKMEASG